MQTLRAYKELSKSGIVALVLISVMGGYLAGQPLERKLNLTHFFLTLLGILFLSSGSSALNQLQEVSIDAKMPRTSKRPIPSGKISHRSAALFIFFTLGLGILILAQISGLVLALGLSAILFYNVLYTLWWKKKWGFAAVPGAIPGALPIWMGYSAANGQLSWGGGFFLFALLFFWQMPHFWVIALKYKEDYALGSIPTLPVSFGAGVTVRQITLWCLSYVALALGGPLFFPVGTFYLIIATCMGLKLLWELKAFVKAPESKQWLQFFLWINFSLIIYIAAAVMDLWGVYLFQDWLR